MRTSRTSEGRTITAIGICAIIAALAGFAAPTCQAADADFWRQMVGELVEAARGDDWELTKKCMLIFGSSGSDDAIGPILECLGDPAASRDACWALTGALLYRRSPMAFSAMGTTLLNGHREARLAAAWVMCLSYRPKQLTQYFNEALDSDLAL